MVTAHEVPRVSAEFLEEERRNLPANVFAAEYLCEFADTVEAVFSTDDVMDALSDDVQPLFGLYDGDAATDPVIVPLFLAADAS